MPFVTSTEMVTESCYKCGVIFAMTKNFYNEAQKRGQDKMFYCPNGHEQGYVTSEAQRIKAQYDKEKKQLLDEIELQKRNRGYAENKANSLVRDLNSERGKRGALTKKLNQVKKGKCPCCDKYFTNIREHMDHKHPNFDPETGTE